MEKVKSVLLVSPTVPETQEYSRATFKSLRRFTTYPDYTLFWAANRQTPESWGYLKSECADADVVIDSTDEDRGCGGGWNAGIEYAVKQDYDYVLCFTNDTLFSEGWLTSLVAYMEENPELGAASPLWHWTGNPSCEITEDDALMAWNDGYSHTAKEYAAKSKDTLMVGFQGCFFMFKVEFLKYLEEFEKQFGEPIPGRSDTISFPVAYWEDADFLMRVWRAGRKARVYHGSCLHHFGAKTLSDPRYHKTANSLYLQNQVSFYRKWSCLDRIGVPFMCHNSVVTFRNDSEVLLPDGVVPAGGALDKVIIERGL